MRAFLAAALVASAAAAQSAPQRPPDSVAVSGVDDAPRRGTFVEAALGVFTAMGGTRAFSSAQPYLAMTIGRDLGSRAAIFASLGLGSARASCYQLSPTGDCMAADSFGATFVELGFSYGFPVAARMLMGVKVVGGYTDLSPGPVQQNGSVPDHVPGVHAGAGFTLDYDTRLDHFGIGLDTLVRETFARDSLRIPSLAVMPRIRYVF